MTVETFFSFSPSMCQHSLILVFLAKPVKKKLNT